MKEKFIIIETTYPNLASAKKLGQTLLNKKLAACVQFLKVESSYFWQEKIENSREILVRIKSKNSLFFEIEKIIQQQHSYEIPQIFSIQINQGSSAYLNWINSSLKKTK